MRADATRARRTGGDRDGAQSATITVLRQEEYPLWDLRVDDSADSAAELRRLHGLFREQVLPAVSGLPTRADPMGGTARALLRS